MSPCKYPSINVIQCLSEKKEIRSYATSGIVHVVRITWLEDCDRLKKEIPVYHRHIAQDLLLPKGSTILYLNILHTCLIFFILLLYIILGYRPYQSLIYFLYVPLSMFIAIFDSAIPIS